MPSKTVTELDRIAAQGSALNEKYGPYFQYVTVADVPEDYADRLTEMFPGQFARLRLLALDVHDLVLAKLMRNSPVDLADAKFLAKAGMLDETVLKQRYEKELRPNARLRLARLSRIDFRSGSSWHGTSATDASTYR